MDEFLFGDLASWEKRAKRHADSQKGIVHNWLIEPRAVSPADSPCLTVKTATGWQVGRVVCRLIEPDQGEIEFEQMDVEWDPINWQYRQVWGCTLPSRPEGTLVRYRIYAHPGVEGSPAPADNGTLFSYLVGNAGPPAWTREAIIYQVFPDRYHPGDAGSWLQPRDINGIFGGTLRGIVDRLDYIADLGFNRLWLNPIFPDDTHHGYQARDYFQVNPRLGTMEDIQDLVAESHSRGIRLLLDFAANHWSRDHPTFQSAIAERESEYHDWYRWIEWPDRYESYYGIKTLPKLNVDHPAMRSHLEDAAVYWLTVAGFDGLRLDHAHGVSLDFWTDFRRVIKTHKPDAWIFGEVTDSPLRLLDFAGRLDGCLDFLLAQTLRNTFATETETLPGLDAFLNSHDRFFPDYFSRPSFLDNHDMNRFSHISSGDFRKLKLAALCQFTLSGPPIVYYGTEAGVRQARGVSGPGSFGLAESRQPMLWGEDQDRDLHGFYRWLIRLRRDNPVLVDGVRETVHLDEAAQTYAYTRSNHQQRITVAINRSEQRQIVEAGGHTFVLEPHSGDVHIAPSV